MPKRILEASTPRARAQQRQDLGTLRQLTVQPATRRRYDNALTQFFSHLRSEGLVLPTDKSRLDPLVCDYVEHLWSSGQGRALACDTLAGLQDTQPSLRGNLPGAWRLLKTWHVNEIPNRAPPLPEHVVHAMAGWGFFHNHASFAVSLLVGFYTMLRAGELLGLLSSHIALSDRQKQALIALGFTKGGKRQGAAESVVLGVEFAVDLVGKWKKAVTPSTVLTGSPTRWRKLFNEALSALKLDDYQFRPYSLRRGRATFWFQKHQNLDRILIQGRWQTQKTARIYLNEGLSVLAQMQIPPSSRNLKPFLDIFRNSLTHHHFKPLEPPAKAGRVGGRGKDSRKGKKSRKDSLFSRVFKLGYIPVVAGSWQPGGVARFLGK